MPKPRRSSYLPTRWTPTVAVAEPSHGMRPCAGCGREHLAPLTDPDPRCFRCWRAANPFAGAPYGSVDAAGDDATDPKRRAEGTDRINLGMPGVDGPDGYRPLTNREVSSNVNRRELAKRAGLDPMERTIRRALPR